jgi:hypothetical protein
MTNLQIFCRDIFVMLSSEEIRGSDAWEDELFATERVE